MGYDSFIEETRKLTDTQVVTYFIEGLNSRIGINGITHKYSLNYRIFTERIARLRRNGVKLPKMMRAATKPNPSKVKELNDIISQLTPTTNSNNEKQ